MIGSMGSLAWLASVGLLLWYSWSHCLHSAALSPSQYLRDRARFAARNPSPAMAVSARCRTASARAWKRSVLLAVRGRCCVAESRRALLRPRRARVTGRPGHRGATNVRRHMRWSFAGCAGARSRRTSLQAWRRTCRIEAISHGGRRCRWRCGRYHRTAGTVLLHRCSRKAPLLASGNTCTSPDEHVS